MMIVSRLAALGVATLTALSIAPARDGGRSGTKSEHPGAALFARHCSTCHTLGSGPSMGPDLAGVTLRRQSDWLLRWIDDPATVAESDSAAAGLVREWGGWIMPELELTGPQIIDLVDFLTAVDAGELGEDVVASATAGGGHGHCMHGRMGAGMERMGPGATRGACPVRTDTTRACRMGGSGHGGHH